MSPNTRTKNNVPNIASFCKFRYTDPMTKAEQKQQVLKGKVALALYSEYGKVPTEQEVEDTYRLARVLYKAVLGTHYMRKAQKKSNQLVMF